MSDDNNDNKPFSQACVNNRDPIFDVLSDEFHGQKNVLEIGSGTGQHAVHIAPRLPHVMWQTSELKDNIGGINEWINAEKAVNVLRPLTIDIAKDWPNTELLSHFNGVFTANTCHIMPWDLVETFFGGLGVMASGSRLAIYGPFKYQGKFTSESNQRFEHWLQAQEPHRGIRDFEAIDGLARNSGFKLVQDHTMPANNQLIVWEK